MAGSGAEVEGDHTGTVCALNWPAVFSYGSLCPDACLSSKDEFPELEF